MTSTPATRILIVEDNALNPEPATEVSGVHGYTALQARTVEEGPRLARSDRPDVILLDVRHDGLAACGPYKEDARTSGIPTVAMTAQAMTGDEAEARLPRVVTRLLAPRQRP